MESPPSTSKLGRAPPLTLDILNDDVLYEICSYVSTIHENSPYGYFTPLKNLSLVNRHFRDITVPILFRNVRIVTPERHSDVVTEGDWKIARAAMDGLEGFMKHIKMLTFDIYGYKHPTQPPLQQDMDRIAHFLGSLPRLHKFIFCVPKPHVPFLASSFKVANITLSAVKTLFFNPVSIFIVPMCPAVETIIMHTPYYDGIDQETEASVEAYKVQLIEALSSAKQLQRFEAAGSWSESDVNGLRIVAPNLKHLNMIGGGYNGYASPLSAIFPALSQFEHLEHLDVETAFRLGMGYHPPFCGNAYMGPGGDELRKEVGERGVQTEEKVAQMAFSACKALKELWVGDHARAVVVRDGKGGIKDVKWTRGIQRIGEI
ncbi:hypothetical protein K432DRAFT_382811 [Lepidopterella palustris CBS 459.81]|uniref:Uncharacterized protein n=1 Tax=Lepidopterella palustris CBS 459.81 TaxID=1314670 RepID=A0A8E2E9I8_9PEZI|nr:hypothetical protein K432DRAFT_382811 [Lepidopterella palustris CBS 459.81]